MAKGAFPIDDGVPVVGRVGKRGSGFVPDDTHIIRKAEVIARARTAWLACEYGKPEERGVLRQVADAYLDAYLGRAPIANEVEHTTKRIMQAIRAYSS